MPSPTAVEPVAPAAPSPGADPVLSFLVGAVRERLGLSRCAVLLAEGGGASAGGDGASPAARAALRDRATARHAGALAVPLRVGGEVRGVLELVPGPVDGVDLAGAVALAEAALGRCAPPPPPDPLRSLPARLSRAVLAGAEPDDVVALLAELLGRPVALLGPDLRVRTWAAPPVLHLVEPPALPAAVAADLDELGPDRPSTVLLPRPLSGLTRRHLVAVLVAEGATAGYLDLIEMGRPLAPAETPLAEHAATLLSLQVLGETRRLRAAALARDDVLADLLLGSRGGSPRSLDDLRRLASHVGLDLTRPQLVVRLPVAPHRSPAACRDAVADALAPVLDGPPPAHAGPDDVVLLVALPADADPSALRRVHAALRTGLDAVARHTGVRRAVVSGVCHDLPDLPPALAETREVDRIVDALGGRADVVAVTELSTLRLVVNGDRADVALRFAEQCLGPLRRSDETGGGDLVETLRCYLDCGAQVRATAKALGVHENTVRYRLGRIEHVTGMDVRRFDTLLAAQLAFQVEGLGAGLETSTTAADGAVAARGARS
ncbi:helix-turn-helix domain-containing protein [Pseudonocardia sp. KRD-182]|uniref:PucR family transcriptional regulator n=1 Tax=Pseudonocardia oceani TaxID=2792013 RepID=UPI001C4A5B2C|nr:helix-turn-helix domain-containing protein [Pseudonocardia oceani]MBW0109819.1 helix-turn-helix domain-containing protein [Pseudonocardia oceani]